MTAGRRKTDPWHEQFFNVRVSPALVGALLASVVINLVHSYHVSNDAPAQSREIDDLRTRIGSLEARCKR